MISQELTLTTSRFDAALDRVTREVEAKSQRMRRSFQSATTSGPGGALGSIGGVGTGVARDLVGMAGFGSASAGLVTIGTAVKSSLTWADDLADLTLKLNESAESLQRVDYAAKLTASMSVEEVANSFIKLERALGDAENEKAAKALENLGLTAEKLAGMSLDEKILALSEAFQKARASGTGVADIQALLGKSSAELIPMLEQSGEALRELFEDAPVLAESTVQEMARINDEFDKLIAKSKSFVVEGVGMATRSGQFIKDVYDQIKGGASLREALDQATANIFNAEIGANREKNERNQSRKDQGRAQGDAAEQAKQDAELERFAQEEAKASAELAKFREQRDAAAKKEREEYQQLKFEQLSPKEQILALNERIAKSLGQRVTDPAKIAAGADAMAAMGDFAGATQVREDLAQMMALGERARGMARVGAAEQGSVATLMDQIFGRGLPEQQLDEQREIAVNARDSKRLLGEILVKMDNPPTDPFSDYGR